MRSSRRPEPSRLRVWSLPWLLIGSINIAAACPAGSTKSPGFRVLSASAHDVNGTYLADARIDYCFSQDAIEAMKNGVPVTVIVEAEVLEKGTFWDRQVTRREARYRIQSHALSKRYLVRNLDTGAARTYRSFDAMVNGLGVVDRLPIVAHAQLDRHRHYEARIRARLDIESLPSPLRPLAYLSSVWHLGSDWYSWPISP